MAPVRGASIGNPGPMTISRASLASFCRCSSRVFLVLSTARLLKAAKAADSTRSVTTTFGARNLRPKVGTGGGRTGGAR